MGLIAKDNGGGDFKKVPSGTFIARCYSIIDLGTQTSTGQYGTKSQPKMQIGWELFGEDDDGVPLTVEWEGKIMPMTIKKSYTVSLHEKAMLRKDLSSWRGADFTEDEAKAFDVTKLIGAYCMIGVTHAETNGKTYANISTISRIPSALKDAKPDPVHANVIYNLDEPDLLVFEKFHVKLQDYINKSPEWIAIYAPSQISQAPSGDPLDDQIPF